MLNFTSPISLSILTCFKVKCDISKENSLYLEKKNHSRLSQAFLQEAPLYQRLYQLSPPQSEALCFSLLGFSPLAQIALGQPWSSPLPLLGLFQLQKEPPLHPETKYGLELHWQDKSGQHGTIYSHCMDKFGWLESQHVEWVCTVDQNCSQSTCSWYAHLDTVCLPLARPYWSWTFPCLHARMASTREGLWGVVVTPRIAIATP